MFDIHSKQKSICWEIAMFRHFEIHRNLASPVPSSIGRNSAKIQIVAGVPELSLSRNHGHLGSVLARPGIKTTGMMATETRGRMVTETRGGAAACSSYVRALPEQVWTIQNMYFVRLQDFQIKIFVLQGLLNYPCNMICIVADPTCFSKFCVVCVEISFSSFSACEDIFSTSLSIHPGIRVEVVCVSNKYCKCLEVVDVFDSQTFSQISKIDTFFFSQFPG